jgi:hypothetical protein
MKNFLALLLLAALAGCGAQTIDDNHGYGYAFDEQAASGLRVRYANANPPRIATLDSLYVGVAICMGVEVLPTGPLVILKDGLIASAGHDAMTLLDTGTILQDSQITTFDWSDAAIEFVVQARASTLNHEMVHFLLKETGFPDDRNSAHDSPFFDSCVKLRRPARYLYPSRKASSS